MRAIQVFRHSLRVCKGAVNAAAVVSGHSVICLCGVGAVARLGTSVERYASPLSLKPKIYSALFVVATVLGRQFRC